MPDTAEFYRIHVQGEWAHICLHEPTGTFMAESSFGTFAHIWTHHGRASLKAFLAGLSFDYFFGKTAASRGRVFSPERTAEALRRMVLAERRIRGIDKAAARRAWGEAGELYALSASEFFYSLSGTGPLASVAGTDWTDLARHEPDPQCTGFWDLIWPEFLAAIRPAPAAEPALITRALTGFAGEPA